MTEATCASCGTSDASVRARPWHDLDVVLCARCYAALPASRPDTGVGFTLTWALLVAGLLLVAAGAAAYLLLR
jgi:hypothetical protein